jgi:hypothetical protein
MSDYVKGECYGCGKLHNGACETTGGDIFMMMIPIVVVVIVVGLVVVIALSRIFHWQ